MLAKTIEYEDYDGNMRKETYWFHMTKADLIKWLTMKEGYTLDKALAQMAEKGRARDIMDTIDDLIHKSYGVRSLNGNTFDKSEEEWKKFRDSEAYSVLFCELATDGQAAAEFINGIIPKSLADELSKTLKENPEGIPEAVRSEAAAFISANNAK